MNKKMKKTYQVPQIYVDSEIEYVSPIATSRLVGGGPLKDEVLPFPSNVIMSEDENDGMTSGKGQGSFGMGNRANENNLWED